MRQFRLIGEIVDIHQDDDPEWIQVRADDNDFVVLVEPGHHIFEVGLHVDISGEMFDVTRECAYAVKHVYDTTEFRGRIVHNMSVKPIKEESDE